VGGVSGEEKTAVLHGLDDEAAHAGDGFLRDGAFHELPAVVGGKARLQFFPDAVVGPEREVFLRCALQVEAADFRRTHGEEREAAVMVNVDKFFRSRRRLRQDAEPTEGIVAIVDGEDAVGYSGAGDSVETVAAGDEVAVEA